MGMTDIQDQVVARVIAALIVTFIVWIIKPLRTLVIMPFKWAYSKWKRNKANRNLPDASSFHFSDGMEDDDHMWDSCETKEDLDRNVDRYRKR